MKRAWWVVPAAVFLLSACDMKSPADKKREAEEAARQKAASQPPVARPEPPEEPHMLVKADAANVTTVSTKRVAIVRIARDGVIDCAYREGPKRVNIGASSIGGGCCTEGDSPENKKLGGAFDLVRDAKCGVDAPPCDEPILLDGDYKAQWLHVRKIVEMMARAHMTNLVIATSTAESDLRGVSAKMPDQWNPVTALPATTKKVDVTAKGKELVITIDGVAYKDVASAVSALQKAGVSDVGIHPADPKAPLWAIVKGVELAKAVAPAGRVRFVLTDQ